MKNEKIAWKAKIKNGQKAEYKRRHDEIWPEMQQVLKDAGIVNYSIWEVNGELFGYYECTKGADYAEKYQAQSPVVAKWNVYMEDVLDMQYDEKTGMTPRLDNVFDFN